MTKRLFDVISSSMVLLLLLPFFLIIAILIKLDSSGPVFFSHIRIGRDFKPFKLFKFRTMIANAHKKGLSITTGNDPRITKVGVVLRKTKLDEFPQLINVLKGDMSIVGPRPEVSKYVEMFRDEYREILKVKPGITDYATIEFRDEESILKKYHDPEDGYIKEVLPGKIELYKKYLRDKGFFTDMKLVFLTFWKIMKT
ncbi:MAG: sugar transferase [wastewater metagenome]|nr:sugar transferase [Candidatus Loosdrechtia aerotolerans]